MSKSIMRIAIQVCVLLTIFSGSVALSAEENSSKAHESELKPASSMPMWFYSVEEQYRYPVPCDFEFAYIDHNGALKITGPFRRAEHFSNGMAEVSLACYKPVDGKWKLDLDYTILKALIDKDGKIARKADSELKRPRYSCVRIKGKSYSATPEIRDKVREKSKHLTDGTPPEDLKAFEIHTGSWGFEDEEGKVYIPPRYNHVHSFSEGLARVKIHNSAIGSGPIVQKLNDATKAAKSKDEKTAREGKKALKSLLEMLRRSMANSDLVGYVDKKGKIVVEPGKYQRGRDFSNGMAAVFADGKWGYIDKSGEEVIDLVYEKAGDFGDGLAPVCKDKNFGYVDKNSKVKIPFKFALAGNFANGLAPATLDGKNWGYIDKSGIFAIPANFIRAFEFHQGRALVLIPPRTDIDKQKSEAINFYLSSVVYAAHGNKLLAKKTLDAARKLDPEINRSKLKELVLKRIDIIDELLRRSGY